MNPQRSQEHEDGPGERSWPRIAAWLALLCALAILLLAQYRESGFLPGHHGYNTSMGLAMAGNLGPEHRFLMFTRMVLDEQGNERMEPHNRLPILSFAVVAAVIAPLEGDPVAQIRVARQLMNLFLWGALVVAYLLVLRISGHPLLAAAAALAGFSSYYLQYYNDMVFNDVPALFGFLLLLLGIARWEAGANRGVLRAGILLGVGFGWQAFGALAAWWSLDLARTVRGAGARPGVVAREISRRPATRALLAAVALGAALLAFNLVNEWRATGEEFGNLPSLRSIRFRVGLAGGAADYPEYPEIRWDHFLAKQARRVMKATVPAGAMHGGVSRLGDIADSRPWLVAGAAAALALFFGWRFRRAEGNRMVLGTVFLSGFFWTFPLRNFSAFHEYQSIFYIGFALVLYHLLLSSLPSRGLPAALVVALALFAWSSLTLNAEKSRAAAPFAARTADFGAIRKEVGEKRRILLGADPEEFRAEAKALRFFMAGQVYARPGNAEFVITRKRDYNAFPLTPGNREYFLFRAP